MTAPTIAITIRCGYRGCSQRCNTPHSDREKAAVQARLNKWVDQRTEVPPGRVWFCPTHASWLWPGVGR